MFSSEVDKDTNKPLPMIWQIQEISDNLRKMREIRTKVVKQKSVLEKYYEQIVSLFEQYPRAEIIEVYDEHSARERFKLNKCSYFVNEWYRDRITERTREAVIGRSLIGDERIKQMGYDTIINSNLLLFSKINDNDLALFIIDLLIQYRPGPFDLLKLLKDINGWAISKAESSVVTLIGVETLWGYGSESFVNEMEFNWNESVNKLSQSSTILKSFSGTSWTEEQFLSDFERYLRFKLISEEKFISYEDYIHERRHYATNGMAGGLKIRGKSLKRKNVIVMEDFIHYMNAYDFGSGFNVKTTKKFEKGKVRLVAAFPLAPSIRDGWLAYHFEQRVKNITTVYWKSGIDADAHRNVTIANLLNGRNYALSYDWKGFENHFTLKLWVLMINVLSENLSLVKPEASKIIKECVDDYLRISVEGEDGYRVEYTGGELSGSRFTSLFNGLLNDGIHFVRDLNYSRIYNKTVPTCFRLSQGDDVLEIDVTMRKQSEQKIDFENKLEIMERMGNNTNSAKTTLSTSVCSFLKNFYISGGKMTKMLSRLISTVVQHNPLRGFNNEENSKSESIVSNFCKILEVNYSKYFENIMIKEVVNVTHDYNSIFAPMALGGYGYLNIKWNGNIHESKKIERWKYTKNDDPIGGDQVWLSDIQKKIIEALPMKREVEVVMRAEMATNVSKALNLLSVDVDYKETDKYYGKIDDTIPTRNRKPLFYGDLRSLTLEIGIVKKVMYGQDFWKWLLSRDEFIKDSVNYGWILRKLGKGFGLDFLLGDIQGVHSSLGPYTERSLKYSALGRILSGRKKTASRIQYGKVLSSYSAWVGNLSKRQSSLTVI